MPRRAPVMGATRAVERLSAAKRGYGRRWQKVRLMHLRGEPLCRHCLGENPPRETAAVVVDHIVPHKGEPGLFWDPHNWQSLCKQHHDIKTAKESGGWQH